MSRDYGVVLLVLTSVVPFLTCALVALSGRFGALANFLAGLLTLGCLLPLCRPILEGHAIAAHLFTLGPGLPFCFSLEPLGLLFGLMIAPLWSVTALYSTFYMSGETGGRSTRFYALIAASIGCALGVALSGSLLTLFFYYEMLTLTTYFLVAHRGDCLSIRAAQRYVILLMMASLVLFLPAIVLTYIKAGTLNFRSGGILGSASPLFCTGLLLLFVFGIAKLALMPMHGWLKQAMVAPTPVSALLHAVAVVKAGVFTLLKLAVYVFGLESLRAMHTQGWLAAIACLAILSASVLALGEDQLKSRLAYSTVGQLAYVTLGVALATPTALFGAAIQMFVHAFAKIALFMAVGNMSKLSGSNRASSLDGIGHSMPWTFFCFLVSSLSIVGLPFFGAFWVKWFLLSSALGEGRVPVAVVLLLGTVLSAFYLLSVPVRAFIPAGDSLLRHLPGEGTIGPKGEPILSFLPPLLTSLAVVAIFFFIQPLLDLLGALPLATEVP